MKVKISELTPKGIILRIIRKVKFFDTVSQRIMSGMVTSPGSREKLNKFHNDLNFDEKAVFHDIFCKTFESGRLNSLDGIWTAQFLNSQIKMPFRQESSWLDWENAISIIGHDADVKQTYETLLESKYRPSVFFDVGANYGTHSLIFLAQGIRAISFEPNPACKKEFDHFCQLNNLSGEMESVAVGEDEGTVDFWFPEKETYLGTIVETTKESLRGHNLETLRVSLTTLDAYTAKTRLYPDLIRIDTEGNEISVIKGATETIKKTEPFIIFECNYLSNKVELWKAFDSLNYAIHRLPLLPQKSMRALNLEEFSSKNDSNLIGLPKNHPFLSERP